MAIEFPMNTLKVTLMLVSMGAAAHGTSASAGMMGSARICLIFVRLASCGLNPLCHKTKFSKGLVALHHFDLVRLTDSNRVAKFRAACFFFHLKQKTKMKQHKRPQVRRLGKFV